MSVNRYVKIGGMESTFGDTYGGSTGLRVTSVNQDIDRGIMWEENIDNYIVSAGYGGALKNTVSLEGNFRPVEQASLLYALFGARASGGLGYTYTLDLPLSTSLSVGERTTGGSIEVQHCGVAPKSASFEFAAKEFVKARYECLTKKYKKGTFSAPGSYSAEQPLVFYAANISLGGVQSFKIKNMTLDIDRKVDDDRFVVGDYTLHELDINGMTEVGGTFNFTAHEYQEFLRAIFGDPSETELDAQNLVGGPVLTITCTNLAESPVNKLIISAGVSIYSKGTVNLAGQDPGDKRIDFKCIGTTFQVQTTTS